MFTQTQIIIAALLVALIIVFIYLNNKDDNKEMQVNENFRVQAHAYASCPGADCKDRTFDKDSINMNPFIWPYSGDLKGLRTLNTDNTDEVAEEPQMEKLTQEQDHVVLST